jgi:hypothetical protein
MGTESMMQAGIVGFEVPGKPRIQTLLQVVDLAIVEFVHHVPDLVEKPFVIRLVCIELVVAVLAHEAFLQRKMSGDATMQIAEESGMLGLGFGEMIDEVDQLLVLVIDGLVTHAVTILPLQQCHRCLLTDQEFAGLGAEVDHQHLVWLQGDALASIIIEAFSTRGVAHAHEKIVTADRRHKALIDF